MNASARAVAVIVRAWISIAAIHRAVLASGIEPSVVSIWVAYIHSTGITVITVFRSIDAYSISAGVNRAHVAIPAIYVCHTAGLSVLAISVVTIVGGAGIAIVTVDRSVQALTVIADINRAAVTVPAINRSMGAL